MPCQECLILMSMGGFFVLLGIGALFWDRNEEQSYYDGLASRTDVREYLEQLPERPGLGALKIGGWLFISLGLLMIAAGGAILLWG